MRRTFFLIFLALSKHLYAQAPATTTLLSVNDGLSQGMVNHMVQSRDGYLWIATKDGLNRYDGYRFKNYIPDPYDPFSIARSHVWCLFEDSRGWLWIEYQDGIDIFNPDMGRFFHLKAENLPGFHGEEMIQYVEDADGNLWVQSLGNLMKLNVPKDLLDKANATNNPFPKLDCQQIPTPQGANGQSLEFTSVFYTKNKTLLAGTLGGLYQIDPQNGKTRLMGMAGIPVYISGQDKLGQIWVQNYFPHGLYGTVSVPSSDYLMNLEPQVWILKNESSPPVRFNSPYRRFPTQLVFDRYGNLWSMYGNTISKWQLNAFASNGKPDLTWTCTEPFVKTPFFAFSNLIVDQSGIAWIGTSGFGFIKISPNQQKFNSYLPITTQRTMTEDPQGNLILCTDLKHFYANKNFAQPLPSPWYANCADYEKEYPSVLLTFADVKHYSIPVFDKEGNAWVTSDQGQLLRIDGQTKLVKKFDWLGLGLILSRSGKILGISKNGLEVFDPEREKNMMYPFPTPQEVPLPAIYNPYLYPNHLLEDSQGVIWIFGIAGLIKATPDAAGYKFEHFKNDPTNFSSLSNNLVLCAVEDPLDPKTYLWVGTKGGGLNRLDKKTGQFRHYTIRDGLPDLVIYGLLTDNSGHLWMSTNKGLCRFDVRNETTKNFTVADGLQSDEFNTSSYYKMRDSTMIFGGVNGLTMFHPDSLKFNENVPLTQIVGVKVNNETMEIGRNNSISQYPNIKLSHLQSLLTFDFAALEFSNPSQNKYRYQLIRNGFLGKNEGENWVDLGEKSTIQFANLSPGSYTFKVLGSNNDGIWSEQPAVFSFTIRPPWWASWWAYLGYAVVLGSLGWVFYRYQIHRKLDQQEALRLKELDDFKNRFFTNITHEFRTPLTVILGTAEHVEARVGDDLKGKMNLIRRNGNNLLRLINQILDLAKLESNTLKINYVQGDVLPYLRYITESLHSLANAQNVMLRVETNEPAIVMDYDQERLLQIVYNLLSNAIKFTPSGGRVTLRADFGNLQDFGNLVLTVTDTGTGIPPEDLPHIFDRFYQANTPSLGGRGAAKAGGTGIGLALTKELVQAMGGSISVESEVGKGAAFTVRLPVVQSPLSQPLTPKGEPKPGSTEVVSPSRFSAEFDGYGSPLGVRGVHATSPSHEGNHSTIQPSNNILLIEDNPDVVEYLAACLGEHYQLDFAYNGRAGIEKALETIPDLIVSDVMMPEKDGFEVCEALKNNELTSHIPIVLLTAKAGVENRIAGLRKGADAYLSKPFHPEELLVVLENLLELRRKLQVKYSDWKLVTGDLAPQSPITSHQSPAPDLEDAFIQKIHAAVLERLSDPKLSVEELSQDLAMSQSQVLRKLKALTGKNTTLFIRSIRLARAKELLHSKTMNVSEVAYEVGFDDPKYFSRVFKEEFGVAPSEV